MNNTLATLESILGDLTASAARLDTVSIEAAHDRLNLLINDLMHQKITPEMTRQLRERLVHHRDLCRFLSDALSTAIRGTHGSTVAYERSGSLRIDSARRPLAPR